MKAATWQRGGNISIIAGLTSLLSMLLLACGPSSSEQGASAADSGETAGRASSAPAPAPRLSPEAQRAVDLALTLSDEAKISPSPAKWDAVIEALLKAHALSPTTADIMVLLAEAHQNRNRFLTAAAWGKAALWAEPKGANAENAEKIAEYSLRQAEKLKVDIFTAAKSLAEKIPAIGSTSDYRLQRAKSVGEKSVVELIFYPGYADHRQGLLTDIKYMQAQSGDCEPEHSQFYWNIYFKTCLERRDQHGALKALALGYASFASEPSQSRQFWPFLAFLDTKYSEFTKIWPDLPRERKTREQLVSAWTRLAIEFGRQEQEARLEEKLRHLHEQAQNNQGDPETIPVEVADLGLPVGVGLQRIRALERECDSALIQTMLFDDNKNLRSLAEIKAAVRSNPHLARARGVGDETALYVTAARADCDFPDEIKNCDAIKIAKVLLDAGADLSVERFSVEYVPSFNLQGRNTSGIEVRFRTADRVAGRAGNEELRKYAKSREANRQ